MLEKINDHETSVAEASQIQDSLALEEGRISVIDFKTGRVPVSEESIPESHRGQMAAYTAALRVIFPGSEIRAALLYTNGPSLFELAA